MTDKDIWTSEESEENDVWETKSKEWIVPSMEIVFRIDGKDVEHIEKKIITKPFREVVFDVMKKHKVTTAHSVHVDGKPCYVKEAGMVVMKDISIVDIFTKEQVKSVKPIPPTTQKYHTHAGLSGEPYSHLINEKHKNMQVKDAHNKTMPTEKQ